MSLLPFNWLNLRIAAPRFLSEQELLENQRRREQQAAGALKVPAKEEPNEKAKKALKRTLASIRCGECTPCRNLSWKKPCEKRLVIFMERLRMVPILDRLQHEFQEENPGLTAREDILLDRFIASDEVEGSLGKVTSLIRQAERAANVNEEEEDEVRPERERDTLCC